MCRFETDLYLIKIQEMSLLDIDYQGLRGERIFFFCAHSLICQQTSLSVTLLVLDEMCVYIYMAVDKTDCVLMELRV